MLERLTPRVVSSGLRAASRRRVMKKRGVFRARGLAGEVAVHTDEWGVPHIRARADGDAFYALGLCHGLDRFFQMDMLRRVLSGRLAETVGEQRLGERTAPPFTRRSTTTDTDRLMRALDLVRAARRYLDTPDEEGRALLDAYVRGVNAAVGQLRRLRPLEHKLLGLRLEPWTALDSLLVVKGMALSLSFKWRTAPVYAAMAETLADRPSLLESILPTARNAGEEAVCRLVRKGLGDALAFVPNVVPPAGSNAFVVSGGRTASGLPVLASDPHLELSLPSIWYMVSMRGSRYATVGATLPGLPGVVIGRTPHVAWGLTNGMVDDADLWAEDIDGTGTRYRVDGSWRPLELETQEIRRRRRSPLLQRMRRTHRGPILTDAFPGYEGPPLSIRLTFHDPAHELETFLAIGRAPHAQELREVAAGYGAPAQNLLYADDGGQAGFVLMGRVPSREPLGAHPALPRDGTDSSTDWQGYLPRSELPSAQLGLDDVVVSANQPQVDGSYPHYLSHLYEPPYRALRIRELLAGVRGFTVDDATRIQMDTHDKVTEWFRKSVLEPHAEAVRRTRPALGRLIDRLIAWDGREGPEDVGPALWHLTYHHLLLRTFAPVLGDELMHRWLGLINLMDRPLRRAFEDPGSPWAPPATRPALIVRALEDAQRDLTARGVDVESPWGAIHTLTLRHPLSNVPVLGAPYTRGPYPVGGGPNTVLSGQYLRPWPVEVVTGASYRQVVDLGDAEGTARMMMLGGQSEVLGSPHYDDLTPMWLAGEGIPMRLETEPEKGERLLLLPG